MLWTLEQGPGDRFTAAVREARTDACSTLAVILREAAATEERAA